MVRRRSWGPEERGPRRGPGESEVDASEVQYTPKPGEDCEKPEPPYPEKAMSAHELKLWWTFVIQSKRVRWGYRIKASTLLGKALGMFSETMNVNGDLGLGALLKAVHERRAQAEAACEERQDANLDEAGEEEEE